MHTESDRAKPGHDLSLYLHIPFCESLCKFCACNRVIMPHSTDGAAERAERYVAAIIEDIRRTAASIDPSRPVRQVHYGGGSPTYLSNGQIEQIQATIRTSFALTPDAEVAMEIDPRTVSPERLAFLRSIGFNRVSMGVQDFDEKVQQHVRRVQPFEMVREVMAACRELEFDSVNFDLIYGMPYQTPATIRDAVGRTISLGPDRVAYYHYAQIPEKIATQRGMDYTKLPDSETKLEMFVDGLELFEKAGYEFVGLDHFAKPSEALARAIDDGTIQRNFQGMTTGGGLSLLGLGVSSISHLPGLGFLQNVKDTEQYVTCIENHESPVERGKRFTDDDCIRQAVINQLYCEARVRPDVIGARFGLDFAEYFSRELGIMDELQRDGLVSLTSDGTIEVTRPLGRVLMRNVAAVFDAYLSPVAYREGEGACFSANA